MRNTPRFLTLAMIAGTAWCAPALADTVTPPHHARHHVHHAKRQAANAPLSAPTAALRPVTAQNSAPMPNESITAPPDRSDQETSVTPAVMQIHYPPMGDGYVTGSSAQAMDDREAAKVTGVQVKVPLGQ